MAMRDDAFSSSVMPASRHAASGHVDALPRVVIAEHRVHTVARRELRRRGVEHVRAPAPSPHVVAAENNDVSVEIVDAVHERLHASGAVERPGMDVGEEGDRRAFERLGQPGHAQGLAHQLEGTGLSEGQQHDEPDDCGRRNGSDQGYESRGVTPWRSPPSR